ncbi:hypothetical protein Cgig2_016776 [Carnegiea gigantea]|uniref:Uncharacterized protein n=1 Tax=Carnegiea gigantea TaxID=171969 RepID=A0A9Q1Q6T2_9CARY|nr:hypothetical protein Cgig2_016776 [Carnegiea gigantea]
MALCKPLSNHVQNVTIKENLQWQDPMIQLSVMSSLVKRTNTTISSPTYNDEQVCLGDSKDRHTTANTVGYITMQYSNLDQHKVKGKNENGAQNIKKEELHKFNAYDEAHRLWINKETIALMAVADNHLENSTVDVWSIIMNNNQLSRQKRSSNRFYSTTYELYEIIYFETQRTNLLNLNKADLLSFSILNDMCSANHMSIKFCAFVHLDDNICLHHSFIILHDFTYFD